MTTTTPQEIDFTDMLIRAHREACINEDQRDQHFLSDHRRISENLWHSLEDPKSFIARHLLDWDEDEGETYESAKDDLGLLIQYWHEDLQDISDEWEVEEIRAGHYWNLYRVTFK